MTYLQGVGNVGHVVGDERMRVWDPWDNSDDSKCLKSLITVEAEAHL